MHSPGRAYIVEVGILADLADLDPADCDPTGACAVDGAYRIVPMAIPESHSDEAAVLDIFHTTVPIARPDQYTIFVRPADADDTAQEGWLRRDLGGMRHDIAATSLKQVIVLRRDLKMRRGKEIAQGAHASMKAVLDNLDNAYVKHWLKGPFTKIAVGVDSEQDLLDLVAAAREAGLVHAVIRDAGRTEFGGVPTLTAAAFGPGEPDTISRLTGHLPLR